MGQWGLGKKNSRWMAKILVKFTQKIKVIFLKINKQHKTDKILLNLDKLVKKPTNTEWMIYKFFIRL